VVRLLGGRGALELRTRAAAALGGPAAPTASLLVPGRHGRRRRGPELVAQQAERPDGWLLARSAVARGGAQQPGAWCSRRPGRPAARRAIPCARAAQPQADPAAPRLARRTRAHGSACCSTGPCCQAGDTAWMDAAAAALRRRGLVPRALWVQRSAGSGRSAAGGRGLLAREGCAAVLCGTRPSLRCSWQRGRARSTPLGWRWRCPCSSCSCQHASARASWQASSIGLGSPGSEPAGRAARARRPPHHRGVGAFKEDRARPLPPGRRVRPAPLLTRMPIAPGPGSSELAAATGCEPCGRPACAERRRLALVLANYPTRNSRLANGVGLDTPASTAAILRLRWPGGRATPLRPADPRLPRG
jgi:hypothetical protein